MIIPFQIHQIINQKPFIETKSSTNNYNNINNDININNFNDNRNRINFN